MTEVNDRRWIESNVVDSFGMGFSSLRCPIGGQLSARGATTVSTKPSRITDI